MLSEPKQPCKVHRVGGRSFSIYLEYDEQWKESYPAYPDFEENPEYTEDGHPFATAEQDSCPYAKARDQEDEAPSDCGGCECFFREQTPYDPIGICMNERLKRSSESAQNRT